MTLEEMEKLANGVAARSIRNTPAEMFDLARALLLVLPVVRAALVHEDTRRAVLGGKDTHAELLRRGEDLENTIDTMRAAMKEGK